MATNLLRHWSAFGTGLGIEIQGGDLLVTLARVRPSGAAMLAAQVIENFEQRPASEWGSEIAAFTRRVGASHVAAVVVLPRRDVMVRQVQLPGVADENLDSAVGYQLDGLHPYPEDEAAGAWARLGDSPSVLVAITRRETVDRYSNLFAEAGIAVAAFTSSAAVLYSACRVIDDQPARNLIALRNHDGELEAYGESPAYPAFSSSFDTPNDAIAQRAISLALAELRLAPDTQIVRFEHAVPPPVSAPPDLAINQFAVAWAAAIAAAVPRNALPLNLLPSDKRRESSKLVYVPTAVLAGILAALCGTLLAFPKYSDKRYADELQAQIVKVRPGAQRADESERLAASAQKRIELIDQYKTRAIKDLDVLNEMTRLLPAPAWAQGMDVTRTNVAIMGETEQSAPLLRQLDQSPLFMNSDFTMPISRGQTGELFRVQTVREPGK